MSVDHRIDAQQAMVNGKRTGMGLYTMKGTRDWDASMWYRGGFRAIALPKCFIPDKEAKDAASKNNVKTWDQLGFFSTNGQMSVYRAEIMNTDPEYIHLVKTGGVDVDGKKTDPVYKHAGKNNADQTTIEREMVGKFTSKADGTFLVNTTENIPWSDTQNLQGNKVGNWTDQDENDKEKKEDPNTQSKLIEDNTLKHDDYSDLIQRVIDDTSLGGNDALNCYWSYNEDDDIVHPQTAFNRDIADNHAVNLIGMGRVYAENIQRYQQILWMNFGIPSYKGAITSLFGGSATKARLINRGNTLASKVGYLTGTIIKIAFVFPLLPLYGILALADLFNTYPVTKYFEHRTAMPMYYKFCNVLIGHMAVNLGLYRAADTMLEKLTGQKIENKKQDNSNIPPGGTIFEKAHAGVPEILKNGPDMLAIMYRKSLKNRQYDELIRERLKDDKLFRNTDATLIEYMKKTQRGSKDGKDAAELYRALDVAKHNYAVEQSREGSTEDSLKPFAEQVRAAQNAIDEYDKQMYEQSRGLNGFSLGGLFNAGNWDNLFGMMMGTALQSIDFIGFKVEKSTSVSESVSNSTEPLEIAGTINGLASQGRSKKDSMIGMLLSGNSGVPILDQVAQFVQGLFGTLADTVGMGNMVNVLTGNGFADIPERWSSSSFSRSYNVEIQLRARYGDPVSWLQSVGIPLAAILAGGMPRGIGDSMYTSPFLVRCYCKGMFSIPTGIIESISMTRGDAEYGWTLSRLPLAINIQLGIKDLSPILYIGMDNDMNTSMDEYMSTLTGLGLYERAFRFPQILRRINRALLIGRNTWANPLWWGNEIGDMGVVKLGAGIYSALSGKGMRVIKPN